MAQDMGDIIRTEVRDIIDGEEGQEHSSGCVGRCKTQRVGAALEIVADSQSTILPDPMPRIDVEEGQAHSPCLDRRGQTEVEEEQHTSFVLHLGLSSPRTTVQFCNTDLTTVLS